MFTVFFWVLYSVSGQCNWLLVVCSHCVLDVRLSSVIVGWLMAIWMNVGYAVFARWLFFFFGLSAYECMDTLLTGHRPVRVHDTALVSLWGCLQSVCFG